MAQRLETVWMASIALAGFAVIGAMTRREATPAAKPFTGATSFVNFESPHVHPMDKTPDGQTLLVCNTPDNRVEIFSIAGGSPVSTGSVPVGLDPITVRARTNTEVWVVNHISDSVSVVDLTTMAVVKTLKTLDEPCDVVFAGSPPKAFVSCSQSNAVQVFDPANLNAAPTTVAIDAERPRALAVSPDGTKVYAAIFESGNGSTILGGGVDETQVHGIIKFPPNAVSDPAGPYGGVNPPPNSGASFDPPIDPSNLPAPKVGLIVRKNASGQWMDDNNHDWTSMVSGADAALSGRPVGWDMPDRDVAVIDASSLGVTYATGLMNICMSVGVNPATGAITVVGTDATNQIRFEPKLKGKFIRVQMASIDAANLANKTITDLNPHLDYLTSSIAQSERNKSIGDPRAVVWNSTGTKGYVAGLGSDNVVIVSPAGARVGLAPTIDVGEGPTGLVLDEANDNLYVLNRFGSSVTVVSLSLEIVLGSAAFHDSTPEVIKVGRKHLYNTHINSGLGQIACASCHIDARMDRLAWDLGDPSGAIGSIVDRNEGFGVPLLEPTTAVPAFAPYHPMKGPMTTQTLQDIIGKEPLHWRGDKSNFAEFASAFLSLQGADSALSPAAAQEMQDYLATIFYGPNPSRQFDNTLPVNIPLPGHYKTGRYAGAAGSPIGNGNATNGISYFRNKTRKVDGGRFACVTCHTLPTGAGPDVVWNGSSYQPIAAGPNGERHLGCVTVDGVTNVTIKVPHLRNLYRKTGFDMFHTSSNAGFGLGHDGSIDSIERFINMPEFQLANDQETADGVAFMLSFSGSDLPQSLGNNMFEPPGVLSQDVPASVGAQLTLTAAPDGAQAATLTAIYGFADTAKVGFIAKGPVAGVPRGYMYVGSGTWQSDSVGEQLTIAQLQALASPTQPITYTVVPKSAEERLGIDRDLDGCYDRDEQVTCSCLADIDGNAFVNGDDFDYFLDLFFYGNILADIDGNTFVNGDDFDLFMERFYYGC